MHGLIDAITRRKIITVTQNKRLLFISAVYHSKYNVISHPVIAAVLDVILNLI